MGGQSEAMIRADETLIEGQWASSRGCALRDANCDRILALVQSYLRRLESRGGKGHFFKDPSDGRIWELSHPQHHLPGGGPPRLRQLSFIEVEQFGVVDVETR